MAGPPTRSGGDDFDEPIALLRPSTRWKVRDFLLPAVITGGVAIVCLVVVHLRCPKEMPAIWQRLTGLAMAGLVAAGFAWSTRQTESAEEFIHRIRSGQHSDFGKRLRRTSRSL